MAATKGKLTKIQQEQVRSAIRTTQLVKRLQFYALDEPDPSNNQVPDLDSGQLRAIETLLKKSLPDLSNITLSGDEDNPITTKDVGSGAAALAAMLDAIASRTSGDASEG